MNSDNLEDVKINVKIILAALWTAHFLLWTFGDMASLLQEISEPVEDELLLFVAVPLAVLQVSMIFFSLVGKPKVMRLANIIIGLIFVLFNLGFLSESNAGWEFLLGTAYLLVNALVIFYAWKWPKHDGVEVTP
jgi:hypothetical protein